MSQRKSLTAGCNCGGRKGKSGYQVNYPDGRSTKVATISEAISAARRVGGTYQRAKG